MSNSPLRSTFHGWALVSFQILECVFVGSGRDDSLPDSHAGVRSGRDLGCVYLDSGKRAGGTKPVDGVSLGDCDRLAGSYPLDLLCFGTTLTRSFARYDFRSTPASILAAVVCRCLGSPRKLSLPRGLVHRILARARRVVPRRCGSLGGDRAGSVRTV